MPAPTPVSPLPPAPAPVAPAPGTGYTNPAPVAPGIPGAGPGVGTGAPPLVPLCPTCGTVEIIPGSSAEMLAYETAGTAVRWPTMRPGAGGVPLELSVNLGAPAQNADFPTLSEVTGIVELADEDTGRWVSIIGAVGLSGAWAQASVRLNQGYGTSTEDVPSLQVELRSSESTPVQSSEEVPPGFTVEGDEVQRVVWHAQFELVGGNVRLYFRAEVPGDDYVAASMAVALPSVDWPDDDFPPAFDVWAGKPPDGEYGSLTSPYSVWGPAWMWAGAPNVSNDFTGVFALLGALDAAYDVTTPYDWDGFEVTPTTVTPTTVLEPELDPVPVPTLPPLDEPGEEVDAGSSFLATVFGDVIGGLLDGIAALVGSILDTVWAGMSWIVTTIWDAIKWLAGQMLAGLEIGWSLLRDLTHVVSDMLSWVGDQVIYVGQLVWSGFTWLVDHLVAMITWLYESLATALAWVVDELKVALTDLGNGILAGLAVLFVPTAWPEIVPPPAIDAAADEVYDTATVFTDPSTGSACGPTIQGEFLTQEIWFAFPSASSGCPGNGPGHSRTTEDESAGDILGFRSAIRGVLLFLLIAAMFFRLVRLAPWLSDQDNGEPIPG